MKVISVSFCLLLSILALAIPSAVSGSEWRAIALAARPLNITENRGLLWVSGADEFIARSADGGQTWEARNSVKGGGLLLSIAFADDHFGYATGTGGFLLVTADGGKVWSRVKAPTYVVYSASFSDQLHGLVSTPRAIYSTADGGTTWLPVKLDFGSDELKKFSFVSTVLALDAKRMAIVLSEGNSIYNHQKLVLTKDGGLSWKVADIPSTGLIQLTKHGDEYWFAGHEVIEKDRPGGGYGVPLLMHSTNGEEWSHLPRWSEKEFSVCNPQGCLYWDGAGVQLPPGNPVEYWTFATEKEVTSKWAVAKGNICSISVSLKCAAVSTPKLCRLIPKAPLISCRRFFRPLLIQFRPRVLSVSSAILKECLSHRTIRVVSRSS